VRFSALLVILLAAGCDHRPPSKQDTPSAKSVSAAADAAGAGAVGDDACLQIGVKIADIIISATTDPTQKAAYEQERTKLVKRFSDNCQRENWPEPTRTCFMAAKSPADVEVCSRDLVKAAGSAGSAGSAGGSGVR